MVGSAQHALAKWLAGLLEPVLWKYSTHCISDSFSFAHEVRSFDAPPEDSFMCSFDIKSLFTNVPLNETISICADYLYSDAVPTVPSFSRDHFVSLMHWATSSVEFSFNGIMYQQHDGIAMGSPLGPILANIFVGFYEEKLFHEVFKPLIYFRYVDDTFALFNTRVDYHSFLGRLNALHPALTFTHEEEIGGKLPFLDVLVERGPSAFLTSIYRKPTFSGLYTHWDSFCPNKRKINLIKTLVDRAMKICSDSELESEVSQLKQIFVKNGYPEQLVDKVISNKLSSSSRLPDIGPKRCPVYLRLPWLGSVSLRFDKQVSSAVSKCFFAAETRVIFTTRSAFPSVNKDLLPTLKLSNIIYHFTCQCDADYVGRTSQRLADRIRQHVPPSFLLSLCTNASQQDRRGTNTSSAIAEHLFNSPECASTFTPGLFSILAKARNTLHLHVLEALYIKKLRPSLCKQRDLLFKLRL